MPGLDGLAALSQVAKEFAPLATSLGQAVEQGVSALSGIITSGVDDAIEKLVQGIDARQAEADDRDDEESDKTPRAEAEFDIGGKHVKFEMGPDGRLKLLLSDATGAEQEFTVELNEHGLPVISTIEPQADNAQSPAPEALSPESRNEEPPAPQFEDENETPTPGPPPPEDGAPGLPSGTVPGARREEDGEHYPKPIPEQGEPDGDADLAEAGPLDAGFAEAGPL